MTDDTRNNPLPNAVSCSRSSSHSLPFPLSPFHLCLRVLASLQLAVALIAVYSAALILATAVEGRYGAEAARFVVYGTPWFAAIHVLLAVNVLCAMLIRIPWRRRQTGFLVTHGGILVLLAGCALTRWLGVEAQLSVYEGHESHVAYQNGLHFELDIHGSARTESGNPSSPRENERVVVPLVPGPFSWSDERMSSWFPWCLGRRSRGTVYQSDGVTLDVLDYTKDPNPAARIRLTVDGKAEEFELTASSAETLPRSQRRIVVGKESRATIALRQDMVDLGFDVHLRKFRRKLDPGSEKPSHYSSLVDFLERSDPPKKPRDEATLQEDVLIKLNDPADFTDPRTGRTYRLFQADFGKQPWLPGDAEFDELADDDHTRDEIYRSDLSVNCDPGRWPKYIGSVLIILGIGIVYYVRWGSGNARERGGGEEGTSEMPPAVSHVAPTGGQLPGLLLGLAVLFSLGGGARAENEQLDWSAWRHLPTFGEGRVMPLDTFARESVEAICGRASPTLDPPDAADGRPQKFNAAELLFAWLAEPEKWDHVRLLPADEELREYLALPLNDAHDRPLRGISPFEIDESDVLARRLDDFRRRAEGGSFEPTDVEKRLDRLLGAYDKYRILTFDPKSSRSLLLWSNVRGRRIVDALKRLTVNVELAKRIGSDPQIRQQWRQVIDSWQKLIEAMHGDGFARERIEPVVAALARATKRLAEQLANPDDATMAALGANLHHQAAQLHLAFYGTGKVLRLLPALDPGALEENRMPNDDASPWLSFQAIMYGSDDLLAAYPQHELQAVRKAFLGAKEAYLDRSATNRAAKFNVAMDQLADSLRALAEKTEPLRRQLPIRHRDPDLIVATAYPPPGFTTIELLYNRLNPFFWSWVVSLPATLCLLFAVGRWRKPLFWSGAAILVIGQTLAIVGMIFRWCVTGLVPLTGMFESVEFVAIYAALLGLWFALLPLAQPTPIGAATRMDRVMQRRLFALAGAIVGFTAAVLAYFAPASVMCRNIGAVMPVLRDNFWLAVHVVTIMASYASAAIALILANIALGYYLFGRYTVRRPPETCSVLAGFIYAALKITVLLLAAGTILGAFWADFSWGHFWGWDPKEVGALLALLAYLLLLHVRRLGWSRDFGMALAAVFGFTVIIWTWYGVNFIMKSGMHAYGSGAGGQWAVITVVAAQWLFLLAAAVRRLGEATEQHRNEERTI
jgi:ABC-type transport system involved in cytochrome c biogenesis permease subunit